MLPSHKIKMAAYYVKNKKCFRFHLGLSRHFDFLAWQQHFFSKSYIDASESAKNTFILPHQS
jgi:hypothetical protein